LQALLWPTSEQDVGNGYWPITRESRLQNQPVLDHSTIWQLNQPELLPSQLQIVRSYSDLGSAAA